VVASSNPALFRSAPVLSDNGTLRFTPADNADGSATVTVRAADDGGTANGGFDTSERTFTITVRDVTAPRVVDLRTRVGSQSVSVLNLARTLPWFNIRSLDIVFSEPVRFAPAGATLTGRSVAAYSPDLSLAGSTATLSLPSALDVDRLMLALSGQDPVTGVRDPAGNLMGGSFTKGLNVLPGDYNGDGFVTISDSISVRGLIGKLVDVNRIFADVDGDGQITQGLARVHYRVSSRVQGTISLAIDPSIPLGGSDATSPDGASVRTGTSAGVFTVSDAPTIPTPEPSTFAMAAGAGLSLLGCAVHGRRGPLRRPTAEIPTEAGGGRPVPRARCGQAMASPPAADYSRDVRGTISRRPLGITRRRGAGRFPPDGSALSHRDCFGGFTPWPKTDD
jgi:hypothetical protein